MTSSDTKLNLNHKYFLIMITDYVVPSCIKCKWKKHSLLRICYFYLPALRDPREAFLSSFS